MTFFRLSLKSSKGGRQVHAAESGLVRRFLQRPRRSGEKLPEMMAVAVLLEEASDGFSRSAHFNTLVSECFDFPCLL